MNRLPVVFVIGPTGVGKSDLAAALAEEFQGMVVNGDSLQVYRDLDIGTAKPSKEMRKRVPHYVFDEVLAPQVWTAADYRLRAREVLAVHSGSIGFISGGSGFYLQALEKGMFTLPKLNEEKERELKEKLRLLSSEDLYLRLVQQDPEAAGRLHPHDRYRVERACVVTELTGQRWSDVQSQGRTEPLGCKILKLGLTMNKANLFVRLKQRVANMISEGLVEEVEMWMNRGFKDWPPLKSVGYRETLLYLSGQIGAEEWEKSIVQNSAALAKRQMTWFRRDPSVIWLDAENESLLRQSQDLIRQFLILNP